MKQQEVGGLALDMKERSSDIREESEGENKQYHNYYKPPALRQVIKLHELKEEWNEQFRQYDINYLQKRFPKHCSSALEDNVSRCGFILQATFSPSDPDWVSLNTSFIILYSQIIAL